MALLECRDLHVTYPTRDGEVHAVEGVSFTLGAGRCLGIVGESGSGKSQTCLALAGLLPRRARVAGSVRLEGRELLGAPAQVLRAVRGARLSMIFQDPLTSLTPHLTVGDQLTEVLRSHEPLGVAAARERALATLRRVQIPEAERRMRMYPFELSGGMRQRVMIAMALLLDPAVILADEPTTALDVTVQAEILDIFRDIVARSGASLILVTHDLGVVAGICDEVLVMYGGRVVEQAPVEALFAAPLHPYTRALLACLPRLDAPGGRLEAVSGQPPSPLGRPPGCSFAPRCPQAEPRCAVQVPALRSAGAARRVACHLASTA